MRPVELGDVVLQMEPPEAGRYHAPILIVPGLFQSLACWRPFTSMLAHRGWEVYTLARQPIDGDDGPIGGEDHDWDQLVDLAIRAAKKLGDKVIVFGADIGAVAALEILAEVRPMAMALFGPAAPHLVGDAYSRALGFFERRRAGRATGPLEAPASLRASAPLPTLPAAEPRTLVNSLVRDGGIRRNRNVEPPPTIVFDVANDPLVSSGQSQTFLSGLHAKRAAATLAGRWWPTLDWQPPCDEAHRFLILTLGDRVVEFPDEILAD